MSDSKSSTEDVFQNARDAYMAGDSPRAIMLLEKVLEQSPNDEVALSMLGGVLIAVGRPHEGIPHLQMALQANPNNVDVLANLGIGLQSIGQAADALAYLVKAVEHAPQRADLRYNLASLLLQTQQYDQGVAQLREVIAADASFLPAYHTLGAVYAYLHKLEDANAIYEEALSAVPNDLQTLVLRANILADTGQLAQAEKAYEELVKGHPEHFLSHAVLGKFLLDIGRSENGKMALQRAHQLNAEDLNTNILLGNVFKDSGQLEEAEYYYRQAVRIAPDHQGAVMNLRRLLSSKIPYWHFEMLADVNRNHAYERALSKVVGKDTLVLDIGTGSGILAMMAARAGAERVVACEMHERLAQTAQEIVERNGYADRISVHHKKSTLLRVGEELPEKADVVVSEILDVGALGEGVLPSIRHASQQLAKPDAVFLPARLKLWGQLVEIPYRSKVAPVREVSGFDLSPMEQYRVPNEYLRVMLKAENYEALSPVMPLLDIDFYDLPPAYPDDQPRQVSLEFPINNSGMLQAIVFWFDLYLDEDIMVSSRPDGDLEHWGQALFCFPNPRAVGQGTTVPVILLQSDQIIRFVLP